MRRVSVSFVLFFLIPVFLFSINGNTFASSPLKSSHLSAYSLDDIEFIFKTTKSFDDEDIENIMNLPKQGKFSLLELEQDRLRIKKFYFDNGFFDAVIDTSTSYNNEDQSVVVSIIIFENDRYMIDKVTLNGLQSIPPELKLKINNDQILKSGDFYSKTAILNESGRIIGILQDNGYLFASLDTASGTVVSKYRSDNPKLKYLVNVELSFMGTDKQYQFGKTQINIKNNKYDLQKHLFERELNYKEGQLYSRKLLEESERNLTKFAIIQSGRFSIDTVIGATVDIKVDITLTNKYEITPNVLALNDEAVNQFFGGAGLQYSDKNFFGGGRVFTVSLQGLAHNFDTYRVLLNTSLYQPYFIRNNMTATYTLQFGFYNPEKGYQVIRAGNLLRVNYFIADYTFYNSAYSDITIDFNRERKTDEYYKARKIDTPATVVNSMNSIIGLTLIHDNTNDLFNPSHGFYHSITFENAGLLPRAITLINKNILFPQYFKFYMPNKFYFDISGGHAASIFAAYNEIGDIIEYGRGDNIIPVLSLYRFYSGGSNSVRGWNAKENGIVKDPSQGGNFLFEGSFEYRWKMLPSVQNFLHNFWLVYFLDYGNIWEKGGDFRFSQIALATGLGLRYDTFVGPLRIDLGFKLFDPKAKEGDRWLFDNSKEIFKSKFAVQFGLGNAF
jgi:outer membrane protein insertion porin family